MNKETATRINHIINDAITAAFKAEGLNSQIGVKRVSGTFDTYGMKVKIDLTEKDSDGVEKGREWSDFKAYARLLDLDPNLLGQTLHIAGDDYMVIGYMPRSKKYPILCQRPNGSKVKWPVEVIRAAAEQSA